MKIPRREFEGGYTIEVKVQPRASRAELVSADDEVLKVRLTAPPVDGEANKQLIALLSKELKVPKSRISIKRGETSRNKLVEVLPD